MSISKDRLAALIKEAADPNKAPLALQALTDEVGGLIDEHAAETPAIAGRHGAVAQLRDTKMQLSWRQTGNPQGAEPEKEEPPDETFDRLFTNAVLKKE